MTWMSCTMARFSTWQKRLGFACALALLCCSLLTLTGKPVSAAPVPRERATSLAVSGSTIASIALHQAQIVGQCGDYYGCLNPSNWCADFARWVWQQAGADISGLSAESGTFYLYGLSQGTLSRTPHVGRCCCV